jgi:hypothetical protein
MGGRLMPPSLLVHQLSLSRKREAMELSHIELPPPTPQIEVELRLRLTRDEIRLLGRILDPVKFNDEDKKNLVRPIFEYLTGYGFVD